MAIPFTLPLQSQVTDENALVTLTDIKNEIDNNNITTSNNTFTGSNIFQGAVIFENQAETSEPPADANGGQIATCKFVNDKINAIPGTLAGTAAPTTSTTGTIGTIYVDTNSGNGYICVNISDGIYNWKQITYTPNGMEYNLVVADWSTENNSIEISIPGLSINDPMWIAPTISEDNSNESNYIAFGVRMKAQMENAIIISCTTIPTEDISITIIK